MGTYFMENSRRYTGYDEYEGMFGPLQASSSSAHRYRGRLPPNRRGFSGSRSQGRSSNLRKGRRSVTREFDRRATFLAKRKEKKNILPLEEDSDGAGDLQDKENEPTSPTLGLQRQVWLPTRNFAFRQRAGKLDTRAIARLDLEKIAATTDIETIQRHLENLAFADVTLDDVQHYSDAYFLKLFQIAQLTLEYLMHVQDSLVDHSEGLEKQCEQLMTECQQFETENGQHETEIASLKREIRQKQRTMATLELMLLNASASNRSSSSAKENAARDANVLVDELLANRTDPGAIEEGSITSPVSCVLCGKRFVSAEYLLRHQQRRHQDAKERKKKKKTRSSGSSSDSDAKGEKRKKSENPAPLPKEVVEALEEKNQLAKQLMALQDQVRVDQEARDRQRQQLETQQNQMSSRVEQHMEKLQTTLVKIEKKQEATKHDLQQYTQEAIARLQAEAANAELRRIQAQKASRAGRLENDDGEEATKSKGDDARWSEKVEKLMDTFMRAQAQKQQEIDALEHESSKLWAKYNKLKKRQQRPEPTMRLVELTALDAERFGVDRGDVVEAETQKPIVVKPTARHEDKRVQTDEENEGEHTRREAKASGMCDEAHTESEPKISPVPAVVVPPIRIEAIERVVSPPPVDHPPAPAPKKEEVPIISPVPKESKLIDPRAKFQHAAHAIGKVALGFLARRALAKASNWQITIDVSSLEAALTAPELEYVRQHYHSQLHVQVEEAMTANDLRVMIAKVLSGKDEFEAETAAFSLESEDLVITATMTYHRVLLHHKLTGVELSGDMLIHGLKNVIEVEIIPYHEVAAIQVGEVIETHAIVSGRIEDIKRASMRLSASDLPTLDDEDDESKTGSSGGKARLVRLQALVRGFLAKKNVELMKIDQLVDARLARMGSQRNTGTTVDKPLEPSWMSLDPVLAAEYEKVEQRLAQALRVKLRKEGASDGEDLRLLSIADYEQHTADLATEQKELPGDAQRRIQLVTERLPPMASGEFRRRKADTEQGVESRTGGAAKIHRAVQVEVVRKRLRRLLADKGASNLKLTGEEDTNERSAPQHSATTTSLLTSWLSTSRESRRTAAKSLGSFDLKEIDQLANAYEEGESPIEILGAKASDDKEHEPPTSSAESKDEKQEEKTRIPQPLTPRAMPDDVEADSEEKSSARPGTPIPYAEANREFVAEAGRSPRPNPGVHVISPFSKTPLISRRAAARRGTGFDNAR
ncbi:Zinc finger protein dzip1 [Phytophthora pseudosyringae]|uniref:Zinc finger protein dzip1 n=1 Tax=Phytophthora pseudosyringae TaxID=221518 RepID=A0A8T1W1N1_9STRA|nr:Zinc finger protein dzip1 [Phytophthora pseudosyringae]